MKSERENIRLEISPPAHTYPVSIRKAENKNSPAVRTTPIISFTGRKRKRSFSFRRLIVPLFLCFIFASLISLYAESKIAPEMRRLAEAQGKKHLLETVNFAVGEMAAAGDVRYDNMVRTIRDSTGEVIYLEVDTAMLTAAKAKLVSKVDESLAKKRTFTLSVPLGSLSGWHLFSGIGIPVRVRLFPIGMTEGEIYTVLEDCGINQTRHLIQVKIKASLLVVLPGENIEVETEVNLPLGERVLVGDVPEIYLDTLGVG